MNLTFAPGSGPGGRLLSQFVNGGNIRLRKKNIACPTERSENAQHFASSQGRTCVFR